MKFFHRLAAGLSLFALAGATNAAITTHPSQTLSATKPMITYTAGPFATSNPSGTAGKVDCVNFACDDFPLVVDLSAGHPFDAVKFSVAWPVVAEDYDIYLLDAAGQTIASGATSGDPESFQTTAVVGVTNYTIRIIPYTVAGGTTTTTIRLNTAAVIPAPPPFSGLLPRFKNETSPPALANRAGEPTMGYNLKSRNAMFVGGTQVMRVRFAEDQRTLDLEGNPLPQACDATWTDVTDPVINASTVDPILQTAQTLGAGVSGRTFVSQNFTGPNVLFGYTDNDGATWTPVGASPPDGGSDHQTIGTGPYPAGSPFRSLPNNPGYAVYFCSQATVQAFCARSDNGGMSFNNGTQFTNQTVCTGTGTIHGHVQVAPDGTVYVPNRICAGAQAITVSTDAGLTWTQRKVPNTANAQKDPAIGVASNNDLYFCYEAPNGGAGVAVSKDRGVTFINNSDISSSVGVVRARFVTAVAGDPNRAACAFIGTTTTGNSEATDFVGYWDAYIATTYDGGVTWQTQKVTSDPLQGKGGVCVSGATCMGNNRNLLDFNDIVTDNEGRIYFAYADGCIGTCVQNPDQNSFSDKGNIIRQTGGRTLFGTFDDKGSRFNSSSPIAPAAACARQDLSLRTAAMTRVNWTAPDTGGSPITNYEVYRATPGGDGKPGAYASVGSAGIKTSFIDDSAKNTDARYFYKVIAQTSSGPAPLSNAIQLDVGAAPPVVDTCKLPGDLVMVDDLGDGGADDYDIAYVGVAETEARPNDFSFTYKLAKFTAGQPPADSFYVILYAGGTKYIALDSTPPTSPARTGVPRFTYGTVAGVAAGVLTFTEQGLLSTASTFNGNGTIVMVAPRTLFATPGKPMPAIGDVIGGLDARARAGAQSATSRDTVSGGGYLVRGTAICAPNTAPVASLVANPRSGTTPLEVNFDASGSSDADASDTIASYSMDFGDGTTQTKTTPLFKHTYTNDGPNQVASYGAKLTVRDSRGLASSNSPLAQIDVQKVADAAFKPFTFVERTNVPVSSFVTSEKVTMSAYANPLPISVTSGSQYSIDGGAFTNSNGMIPGGATLVVRHISADKEGTPRESQVTVGSYMTNFRSVTTTVDRVPDAFTFGSFSGQAPSTLVESDVVTLMNFDIASIVPGPNVAYRINGGTWTVASGTLKRGETLQVRHTTNASHLGYTKTYLKVGGVTGYFLTRTR